MELLCGSIVVKMITSEVFIQCEVMYPVSAVMFSSDHSQFFENVFAFLASCLLFTLVSDPPLDGALSSEFP